MAYRFAVERTDYGDLASGAVLRSAPGLPAFPVRLASEIFQRAVELRGGEQRAVVWDPLCGGGYLLTVLAMLHRERIAGLIASDVDERALEVARANLGLLTAAGLAARRGELADLADRYGKAAHLSALAAADRLTGSGGDLVASLGRADVFDTAALRALLAPMPPDVVVTDIPYGEQVSWQGGGKVEALLESLDSVLPADAIVAVTGRGRRIESGRFRPARSFRVGTRATALFRIADRNGGS
ncbi:hypothetical protein [Nocardia pseudobrasiliensis]|uniref:rRNA methyltransferase AviRa n=1 Tax=Nocardia pseudobrasiliensis TaxID=45979 RepID=A0A370I5T1_9NOCA|nr:hypothetical protein [Nocardia pseudobrasiliensis]RDI66082.1 RRNA methyltransferase AviRa [Nocardia pseudobrasiliensis]